MRQSAKDRRKVNVPVGEERRVLGKNNRKCPECHSALQSSVVPFAGGTWTITFCTKCNYRSNSKQIDEGRMQEVLGFETVLMGSSRKPILELDPDFLRVSNLKPGDTLEIKPLFTPGANQQMTWVIKKVSD